MSLSRLSMCWAVLASLLTAPDSYAQSLEPPLSESRLTIHTLVREDIFAGFRSNEMQRFERGERNIDRLLDQRPDERAALLAWKGGAKLFRAILAHEADDKDQFEAYFREADQLFASAHEAGPEDIGVAAVRGASYQFFADRLPKELRQAAWEKSYEDFHQLWDAQSEQLEHLPVHIRGELLAGLAQSSLRTGREDEAKIYLDMIIEFLPDTRYAFVAKTWQDDPSQATQTSISCKTCHNPGKLTEQLKGLGE